MGAGRWGNPLLLLAALALVLGRHQQWPGFQDSESPRNVNATLTFLLENYNNKSNDSYLFGIDKLLRSQVQLTTGVEYLITVKISRTKCKRNSTKNRSCPIQTKKNLKKVCAGKQLTRGSSQG
uniref:Cystatin domain-containing protein n=1 Tax=Bos indicus x Bos taurus TaxID=30522 RepID=A0A4W2CPW4_BOBOX